jgi:hypothetical protein
MRLRTFPVLMSLMNKTPSAEAVTMRGFAQSLSMIVIINTSLLRTPNNLPTSST